MVCWTPRPPPRAQKERVPVRGNPERVSLLGQMQLHSTPPRLSNHSTSEYRSAAFERVHVQLTVYGNVTVCRQCSTSHVCVFIKFPHTRAHTMPYLCKISLRARDHQNHDKQPVCSGQCNPERGSRELRGVWPQPLYAEPPSIGHRGSVGCCALAGICYQPPGPRGQDPRRGAQFAVCATRGSRGCRRGTAGTACDNVAWRCAPSRVGTCLPRRVLTDGSARLPFSWTVRAAP